MRDWVEREGGRSGYLVLTVTARFRHSPAFGRREEGRGEGGDEGETKKDWGEREVRAGSVSMVEPPVRMCGKGRGQAEVLAPLNGVCLRGGVFAGGQDGCAGAGGRGRSV